MQALLAIHERQRLSIHARRAIHENNVFNSFFYISVFDADFSTVRAVQNAFGVRAGQNRLYVGDTREQFLPSTKVKLAHYVVQNEYRVLARKLLKNADFRKL